MGYTYDDSDYQTSLTYGDAEYFDLGSLRWEYRVDKYAPETGTSGIQPVEIISIRYDASLVYLAQN